jgi:hypothetical protein
MLRILFSGQIGDSYAKTALGLYRVPRFDFVFIMDEGAEALRLSQYLTRLFEQGCSFQKKGNWVRCCLYYA